MLGCHGFGHVHRRRLKNINQHRSLVIQLKQVDSNEKSDIEKKWAMSIGGDLFRVHRYHGVLASAASTKHQSTTLVSYVQTASYPNACRGNSIVLVGQTVGTLSIGRHWNWSSQGIANRAATHGTNEDDQSSIHAGTSRTKDSTQMKQEE